MTLTEKIDALRQTFGKNSIKYVELSEWTPSAKFMDATTRRETHGGRLSYSDVKDTPTEYPCRAYVDLTQVGKSECQAGQSTTLDRSNYRSIMRDYPDMFTPVSYSNVDTLGAYVGNLSEDAVSMLCGLVTDYPAYDDSDMSELESEEITESFEQYVCSDLNREIPKSHVDQWDELTKDQARDVFWSAVTAADYYPQHDGHDVCWRYEDFMPQLLDAIETASANGYNTTFDHFEPASTFYRPPLF